MESNGNTNEELRSRATKEELVAEIKRLNDLVKDQKDQIAERDAALSTGSEGWNISTPNQEYSGRTMGVWFEKGHAFIPTKMPDAERLVNKLVRDMGYSATPTNTGQPVEPPKTNKDNRSVAEKLTQPQIRS
jgi:hypothetical protein